MAVADSGTLHHTGFVVHDVDKTAAALAASGFGPWNAWTIEPASSTVHGRDVPLTFRVALAPLGGSTFELLAPLEGESVYVEHLAAKGEGFHHTCVAYPTRDALHDAKEDHLGRGRTMVQSADLGELGEFCYFEIPEISTLLELLYLTELPPPDATIG